MWIMTFIAEYFNDISTAQYEDKTLLRTAIISVQCCKHFMALPQTPSI